MQPHRMNNGSVMGLLCLGVVKIMEKEWKWKSILDDCEEGSLPSMLR